jgi:hypothetical protein
MDVKHGHVDDRRHDGNGGRLHNKFGNECQAFNRSVTETVPEVSQEQGCAKTARVEGQIFDTVKNNLKYILCGIHLTTCEKCKKKQYTFGDHLQHLSEKGSNRNSLQHNRSLTLGP